MAKRKIIWSAKARIQQLKILQFYADRNGNKRYSIKLYRKIQNNLKLVSRLSYIGKQTDKENIRYLIVADYQIFYEVRKQVIEVLLIWDCRRNPENLRGY